MQDGVDILGKPISDIVISLPPMESSKCLKSCEAKLSIDKSTKN